MLNTLAVNGGTSQNKGDVTSFNSDGTAISWTIGTATAFQHGYLAFGQAASASHPLVGNFGAPFRGKLGF